MKRRWNLLPCSLVLLLSSSVSAGMDGQRLTASDAQASHGFGWSVDVSGDRLAVGALWDDDMGLDAGAVYLFERQAGVWVQTQKLLAFDGAAGQGFGYDVALEGGLLAVSARGRVVGTVTGVVYVYSHDGTTWSYQTTLVPAPAGPYPATEEFGDDVKVGGGKVAVRGNYFDQYNDYWGRFHVFSESQGAWSREMRVDHYHVNKMAFDAETLVPSSTASNSPILQRGYALVHDHDAAGGNWVFGGVLHGDADEFYPDGFGAVASVDGDRFAVVATHDTDYSGAVYFFRRGAGVWEREARVVPLNGGFLTGASWRGLGLSGDWMVVAWNGALVFRRDGTDWVEDHLIPPPPGTGGFGSVIRVDGSTAAMGDWRYDEVATDVGAVFVYELAPLVDRYCTSTINSSGNRARIDISGSMSVSANDAQLFLSGAPAGVAGIFSYGEGPTWIRLGNGYVCIDPGAPVFRRYPLVATDADGSAQTLLDFPNLPASGTIAAGSTWNFQCFFRDPAAGGSRFNTTDAVAVTFLP